MPTLNRRKLQVVVTGLQRDHCAGTGAGRVVCRDILVQVIDHHLGEDIMQAAQRNISGSQEALYFLRMKDNLIQGVAILRMRGPIVRADPDAFRTAVARESAKLSLAKRLTQPGFELRQVDQYGLQL